MKESQIYSYLSQRGIIPSVISIFKSKRRGTISAKIHVPSASSSFVLKKDFWPKFVCCKAWIQKTKNKNKPLRGKFLYLCIMTNTIQVHNATSLGTNGIPVRITSRRPTSIFPIGRNTRNRHNLIPIKRQVSSYRSVAPFELFLMSWFSMQDQSLTKWMN